MSETHKLIDHLRQLNPDFDRNEAELRDITDAELRQEVSPDAWAATEELYRAADAAAGSSLNTPRPARSASM